MIYYSSECCLTGVEQSLRVELMYKLKATLYADFFNLVPMEG